MSKSFTMAGLALAWLGLAGCSSPQGRPAHDLPKPASAPAAHFPTPTNAVESLVASIRDAIVTITPLDREGRDNGVGAGFVIDPDGLIATSLHVIGEARPVRVQLADGRRLEVTGVHAWDRRFDLAIVRVDAGRLPALKLGDSDKLAQGAPVVAVGNPLGLRHSVVPGVVSAKRELEGLELIQLAIPLEPGNSGGPLVDLRGRVQGVLTLKSALTPNLGFAMPVNLLKTLIERPNPVPIERWLNLGALDAREWEPLLGARWSRKTGRIAVEGAGAGFGGRSLCLARPAPPARPFVLSVQVKLDDESGAAGLVFGADGDARHWGFYPSGGNLRLTRFEGPDVFSWQVLREVFSPHYQRGEWNLLQVEVGTNSVRCHVNGRFVCEADLEPGAFAGDRVGLAKFRDTRAEFKGFQAGTNVAVAAPAVATLEPALREQVENLTGAPDDPLFQALQARPEASRAFLEERARQLDGGAARLRALAARVHEEAVRTELVRALDGPEDRIDLALAALLVAKLDNPDLEVAPYREQVRAMAREVKGRLPAAGGPGPAPIDVLREFLFTEHGFHGSRSDYYNRANSYLDQVLDEREGLPITLAVLFLEVARGAGIPDVSGLPLPGHFMVRHAPAGGTPRILDVFNGGREVTLDEAQEIVAGASGEGFRMEHLQPATRREIIIRMVRNLHGIAERNGNTTDRLRHLDTLVALAPDNALDRLARARLRLQTLDVPGGKADLKWLLDHRPPGVDLERLAELYQAL